MITVAILSLFSRLVTSRASSRRITWAFCSSHFSSAHFRSFTEEQTQGEVITHTHTHTHTHTNKEKTSTSRPLDTHTHTHTLTHTHTHTPHPCSLECCNADNLLQRVCLCIKI